MILGKSALQRINRHHDTPLHPLRPGNLSGTQALEEAVCSGFAWSPQTLTHGVITVKKTLTYALLLATALVLAACEKTPEDKMESAKESVSEAMENLGDAAKDTGEAIEQKTNEALGNEPTTGEKIEDAASDAADAIEDAGDEVKDAVDDQ